MDDNRPSDEEILRYERQIKEEELGSIPLIGDKVDFSQLEHEYSNGAEVFQRKIKQLKSTCSGLRCSKRDGNCFYRSLGFRMCELLWQHPDSEWSNLVIKNVHDSRSKLKDAGYDDIITEDFFEPLQNHLKREPGQTLGTLLQSFQTDVIIHDIYFYSIFNISIFKVCE